MGKKELKSPPMRSAGERGRPPPMWGARWQMGDEMGPLGGRRCTCAADIAYSITADSQQPSALTLPSRA